MDPLIEDKLGKLNVSREGLIERNKMVFDAVDALQIPCIVLMGGGYANPIGPTVTALCDLFMGAAERHHKRQMRTT